MTTEESPVRVCHNCQTPLGHKPDRVAGELYCQDCIRDAVLQHRA